MKILIAIPIYLSNDLHVEFTQMTLDSIKTSYEYQIVLIRNYASSEFENITFLNTEMIINKENCVSSAWNIGIRKGIAEGYDYIILPNNDLIFRHDCIDNLVKFAEEHKEFILWTAAEHIERHTLETYQMGDTFDEHPHFSCFMVSPKTVEFLKQKEEGNPEPYPGFFDENIKPAYHEDGDLHQRILRAGCKAGKTASALFYHWGSRTIKTDDELDRKNSDTYEVNRAYIKKKWGFDFHNRVIDNNDPIRFKYKEPFELKEDNVKQ